MGIASALFPCQRLHFSRLEPPGLTLRTASSGAQKLARTDALEAGDRASPVSHRMQTLGQTFTSPPLGPPTLPLRTTFMVETTTDEVSFLPKERYRYSLALLYWRKGGGLATSVVTAR